VKMLVVVALAGGAVPAWTGPSDFNFQDTELRSVLQTLAALLFPCRAEPSSGSQTFEILTKTSRRKFL